MRYELRHTKHGVLLIDVDDKFVGRAILAHGEYSWEEVMLLCSLVGRGSVVLEAGAHIGTITVPLARTCGVLFAFEPQRLLFQLLCANLALNGILNVRAYEQAVGADDGMMLVPPPANDGVGNTGGVTLVGVKAGDPVGRRSVDSMKLSKLDLLKADVEDMELDVVRGARETIARLRPVLYLEANTRVYSDPLLAELHELGYECRWHFPGMFIEEKDNKMICSMNLLCMPDGRAFPEKPMEPAMVGDEAIEVATAFRARQRKAAGLAA